MKKRKRNRAERARKKRARREEKRQMKGTMTMAEKKIITAEQIHAYVKKEKYAEAINAFADALAQGEPPKECYGDVAHAYFEMGDYKRAADWISNALSINADDVDVRILLARICQREKRTDDALKLYENILSLHQAVLTDAQRAEIERRAGLDARLTQNACRVSASRGPLGTCRCSRSACRCADGTDEQCLAGLRSCCAGISALR